MAELGSILGGRYRLDQVLGQGGMATIFAATDTKLGRQVAVKVLRPEFGADAAFVERFRREAQAAGSLNHPNIVAVHDYGTDRAGPYIVMEQVAGGDLARVLSERGALPPTAVARTGQQVADALATAHARGLVHRDIKPANILLSPDGRVQVADFGIAQATASAAITEHGVTLGSVLYFSPEQARGDIATPASDIYSLGLVLYEMLTGQRAFAGDSPAAIAVARLAGGVPSPLAVRAEVPAALDAIVRWCLGTDPATRPSAPELSAALSRFLADPSSSASYGTLAALGTAAVPGGMLPPPTTVLEGQAYEDQAADEYDDAYEPERGGSGPWTWVAAGFGLLVVAAAGILLFLLFSGIGNEEPSPSPSLSPTPEMVATPRFEGRPEARAERLAQEAGLFLERDYQETTADQAGRVIDQLPGPGVEVAVGTSVKITVGTLAETVVVPDVRGLRPADAVRELEAAGLLAGARRDVRDSMRRGYVAGTDPRAGVSMTRGSAVDLNVSTGEGDQATPRPTTAPRVTPTPRPARTPRPTPTPGATPRPTPTPAVTSGPGGGRTPPPTPTPIPDPTPTLSPTPGPTPSPSPSPSASPSPFPSAEVVVVGNFECLDLGTARSQIEAVGLLMGTIIPDSPPREDSWIVHDQLPAPGLWVPVGSAVDLVVMEPLEPCPAG